VNTVRGTAPVNDEQRNRDRVARMVQQSSRGGEPPTPYHLRYRQFHPRTIAATRRLFDARPHRMNPMRQVRALQQWVDEVSDVYGIPPARVRITSRREAADGYYDLRTHEINLPKCSVLTLMHEFAHHKQNVDPNHQMVQPSHGDVQHEEDARAWSQSIFYKIKPVRYRRLALEGRILHTEPETMAAFAERERRDA
jgi:hypothetical protein